jgi:transcriptional regulator with XRE-family HTH domain
VNLERLMAARNLNQVELSRKSGISQGLISSYIRQGKAAKFPSLQNMVKLAGALHCTLEELTGLPALHSIEEKVAAHQPSPEALAFAEALEKLPADDPRRKAIEVLLMDVLTKSDKKPKPQNGEEQS